eukprot:Sspe_Gene.77760::Locus_48604_Transcript_1_1_Confidence_1.000_Length_2638::g.77760::m.77760
MLVCRRRRSIVVIGEGIVAAAAVVAAQKADPETLEVIHVSRSASFEMQCPVWDGLSGPLHVKHKYESMICYPDRFIESEVSVIDIDQRVVVLPHECIPFDAVVIAPSLPWSPPLTSIPLWVVNLAAPSDLSCLVPMLRRAAAGGEAVETPPVDDDTDEMSESTKSESCDSPQTKKTMDGGAIALFIPTPKATAHADAYIAHCAKAETTPSTQCLLALWYPTVTSLVLEAQPLGAKGVEALCTAFSHNRTVKEVVLKDCGVVGADCGAALSALLESPCPITTLSLQHNNLAGAMQPLSRGLARSAFLRHLCLSQCSLSADHGDLIAMVLHETSLDHLDLSYNTLTSSGAGKVLAAVPHRVKVLDISHNNIADGLRVEKPFDGLEVLRMQSNPLGDSSAKALGDTLSATTTVTELDFNHCGMTSLAAQYLVDSLVHHPTLTTLRITTPTPLGLYAVIRLSAFLQSNSTLRTLDAALDLANHCSIVAEALKANSSLTSLNTGGGAHPSDITLYLARNKRGYQPTPSTLAPRYYATPYDFVPLVGLAIAEYPDCPLRVVVNMGELWGLRDMLHNMLTDVGCSTAGLEVIAVSPSTVVNAVPGALVIGETTHYHSLLVTLCDTVHPPDVLINGAYLSTSPPLAVNETLQMVPEVPGTRVAFAAGMCIGEVGGTSVDGMQNINPSAIFHHLVQGVVAGYNASQEALGSSSPPMSVTDGMQAVRRFLPVDIPGCREAFDELKEVCRMLFASDAHEVGEIDYLKLHKVPHIIEALLHMVKVENPFALDAPKPEEAVTPSLAQQSTRKVKRKGSHVPDGAAIRTIPPKAEGGPTSSAEWLYRKLQMMYDAGVFRRDGSADSARP